jgi:hypothetical protein
MSLHSGQKTIRRQIPGRQNYQTDEVQQTRLILLCQALWVERTWRG